jgi:hypothetical protein
MFITTGNSPRKINNSIHTYINKMQKTGQRAMNKKKGLMLERNQFSLGNGCLHRKAVFQPRLAG